MVRENTEGEYSSIGGKMFAGAERHLTSAIKSNGIAITLPYWDERVAEMGRQYPDVKVVNRSGSWRVRQR